MKENRKSNKRENAHNFYGSLFAENPYWSSPYPNPDEAARLGKIMLFLSFIFQECSNLGRETRILDVGCGRGWLAKFASVYGVCHGIDPVHRSIESAKTNFPELDFYACDLSDFLRDHHFKPYDIVIASEVIEHVEDKNRFVQDLTKCLTSQGYLIITTPRGEEYQKWLKLNSMKQPVESWITEKDLQLLFHQHDFTPIKHDRVYLDLPEMSLLHRICANHRIHNLCMNLGMTWFLKGLKYISSFYQVWTFKYSFRQ